MIGMGGGFRILTFPDRSSPRCTFSAVLEGEGASKLARLGSAAHKRCVFPHTKWAWRPTAKCVTCEIGIICREKRKCAQVDSQEPAGKTQRSDDSKCSK